MEVDEKYLKKKEEVFALIDRATIENDELAYAELMKLYKKPVYHMILKMVRNVDDAEDLTRTVPDSLMAHIYSNPIRIFLPRIVASCCDHGKYPPTIVLQYRDGTTTEMYSGARIPRKKRFYKKDEKGYYFIPEVSGNIEGL